MIHHKDHKETVGRYHDTAYVKTGEGYKKITANQDAMLERQTARIVDLQTHIENFEGEE